MVEELREAGFEKLKQDYEKITLNFSKSLERFGSN